MKIRRLMPLFAIGVIALASCGNNTNYDANDLNTNATGDTGQTPTDGDTTKAEGEPTTPGDENPTTPGNGDTTPTEGEPTTPGDENPTTPGDGEPTGPTVDDSFTKVSTKIYMVGDSTMCEYVTEPHYYPRYGYGTQMYKFFDSEYVTITNLALSGRSSYSFLGEKNYTTLINNISEGDYLIIGWGHNDEKYGTATFRNAKYDTIDQALADDTSFQRCVYDNYVKMALDKGAYPIIATPIVRADKNDNYNGASAHITDYGDYRQAGIDLATKYNIPYVDLTTLTKTEYSKIGYSEAIKYHDISKGTDESSGADPDWASVDTTHINYYGATYVSYEFANALSNTNSNLKYYVNDDITKPTIDILTKNPNYKWTPYAPVDLTKYAAGGNLNKSGDWYGTAFGDLGGGPQSTGNGYWAKSIADGVYKVGQGESTGTTTYKGKIDKKTEGASYMFQKLPAYTKFKITAEARIASYTGDNKQGGFGLTLLDACWINETAKDSTKVTGGTYAGILTNSQTSHTINFSRNMALEESLVKSSNTYTGSLAAYDASATSNTVFYFEIERTGQEIYCRTKIGTETVVDGTKSVSYGQTYETRYVDFDFFGKDNQYVYLAMFGARGYLVEFYNVNFTNNGEYAGA